MSEKKLIIEKIKQLNSPLAIEAMEEELKRVNDEMLSAKDTRTEVELAEADLEVILNHCKYFV